MHNSSFMLTCHSFSCSCRSLLGCIEALSLLLLVGALPLALLSGLILLAVCLRISSGLFADFSQIKSGFLVD